MESVDRQKLRKNHVMLIRHLNPEDVTDYLYQEHVLSEEDCENIHAGVTRVQKVRTFLKIIPNKSIDAFSKLLFAINEAGYTELHTLLDSSLEPDEDKSCPSTQPRTDTPAGDAKLISLKEKLEQQYEIVHSIEKEISMVRYVPTQTKLMNIDLMNDQSSGLIYKALL